MNQEHTGTSNFLKKIVKSFEGKSIAVIGDVIVDKFVWGKVSRISPMLRGNGCWKI